MVAIEQPTLGVMETDWAENRADMPSDFLRNTIGKYIDVFGNTYKRDKFRTRIEVRHRAGHGRDLRGAPRSRAGADDEDRQRRRRPASSGPSTPPDPGLEAEMLARLMMKFGTPAPQATAAIQAATRRPRVPTARGSRRMPDGTYQLVVDDSFDRAWRRVGLALDRVGFTVVDRDRSKGTYFVRYADPETEAKKQKGFLDKLHVLEGPTSRSPSSTGSPWRMRRPRSVVTVQDPNGAPDKSANGEKILSLLQEPAQVAARRACASRPWAAAAKATGSSSNRAARAC